ncbi:DUF986 family protein [Glaesserella parasuis]|uniref:DUF986 family protein n=1 Tax=Glaesserella parasuis TaxID=738 RepID=UPI0024363AA2|nr:DUF986 family protein [Glaesserella parasuis]MDG6296656.1 DUF986 family protein [Glaesserella parasuis]
MTNILLILAIGLSLLYILYDQLIMDRRNGETRLSVPLIRQASLDTGILIALIVLIIVQGVQTGIEPLTVFLLCGCIVLAVYSAFIRYPRLLLKEQGFFFDNFYFLYSHIAQINLADQNILVIDLKNNRRLFIRIKQKEDIERVVNFFGGYKK